METARPTLALQRSHRGGPPSPDPQIVVAPAERPESTIEARSNEALQSWPVAATETRQEPGIETPVLQRRKDSLPPLVVVRPGAPATGTTAWSGPLSPSRPSGPSGAHPPPGTSLQQGSFAVQRSSGAGPASAVMSDPARVPASGPVGLRPITSAFTPTTPGSGDLPVQRWLPGLVRGPRQAVATSGRPLSVAAPYESPATVDMPVVSSPAGNGQIGLAVQPTLDPVAAGVAEAPVSAGQSRVSEVVTVSGPSGIREEPAGTPSARTATTAQELDELARRLYEPLASRLRTELLVDRERRGQRTDAW
ncbi:hypothetical protein [Humibacillus sp. DSM 29435]|uniref:hypothetical protein n=1 Tax=Humibacillus sp. DSM 29435 TaxID=1869167 RepID=UPI0011132232|nr:hypothetical protein [Humibacillus sp. DSM 29435]